MCKRRKKSDKRFAQYRPTVYFITSLFQSQEHVSSMTFTDTDKRKALAIVHIFETSQQFGDYAACAVLNDGAGVSYGINQFTHRSGSLSAVINLYLRTGGQIGRSAFAKSMPLLRSKSAGSITMLAADTRFKKALEAAAITREMREAQDEIAFQNYLLPAIAACEVSQFVLPLTLAVIYDSINHGSWEKMRDRVKRVRVKEWIKNAYEKAWITEYVQERNTWLKSISRLRPTAYRTDFFLVQIEQSNWNLDLPINIRGQPLKEDFFKNASVNKDSAVEHQVNSAVSAENPPASFKKIDHPLTQVVLTEAQPPINKNAGVENTAHNSDYLDVVQKNVDAAAAKYDQVETVVQTVLTRTDAAKSLWTTIAGTLWQGVWALGAFAIGLPSEVWLVAALVAAALMLLYLYRQIVLGKIRELSVLQLGTGEPQKKQTEV